MVYLDLLAMERLGLTLPVRSANPKTTTSTIGAVPPGDPTPPVEVTALFHTYVSSRRSGKQKTKTVAGPVVSPTAAMG